MGPTDIIREWFENETQEVKGDVAFLILSSLGEREDLLLPLDELTPRLIDWLTPGSEPPFRTVGKAVSFVAVFDLLFAKRFTPEGWERPRRLFESVLSEPPSENMAETAREALADMPRKEARWHEVGNRWQAVENQLTPEFLEIWNFTK